MTPPPLWHFSKKSSDLVAGSFPKEEKTVWNLLNVQLKYEILNKKLEIKNEKNAERNESF